VCGAVEPTFFNSNGSEGVMQTFNEWELPNGDKIYLVTLEELRIIQENDPEAVMINIFGDEKLAKDADTDVRFGFTAYGVKGV
jgi:hypothetical protein